MVDMSCRYSTNPNTVEQSSEVTAHARIAPALDLHARGWERALRTVQRGGVLDSLEVMAEKRRELDRARATAPSFTSLISSFKLNNFNEFSHVA